MDIEHANVGKIIAISEEKNNDLWIVAEDVGQNMLDYFAAHKPDDRQRKIFLKRALEGLEHLHSNGIAQGDVKAENLCIDENNRLRIVDFDLASKAQDDGSWIFAATLATLQDRIQSGKNQGKDLRTLLNEQKEGNPDYYYADLCDISQFRNMLYEDILSDLCDTGFIDRITNEHLPTWRAKLLSPAFGRDDSAPEGQPTTLAGRILMDTFFHEVRHV